MSTATTTNSTANQVRPKHDALANASVTNRIDSREPTDRFAGTDKPLSRRVVIFDSPDRARLAIKRLAAAGYSSRQIDVLCNDKLHLEKLNEPLMVAESKPMSTKPYTVGLITCLGASVLGGAGFLSNATLGVAGLLVGSAIGWFLGALMSEATRSNDRLTRLTEHYQPELADDKLAIVVNEKSRLSEAEKHQAYRLLKDTADYPMNR